ncbi:hypothetical protein ACFU0X_10470 [Streptomyces cellulosae]|uniref:Uncharacterized protein n=1 Tax=Streptomyces cellulosae TaxID=1968 RepID=A0ABW6JG70_STRCE
MTTTTAPTLSDEQLRVRERALRLAYISDSPYYVSACYGVERVLDMLSRELPAAADELAAELKYKNREEIDAYVLAKAAELGIDTSEWVERRQDLLDMTVYRRSVEAHDGSLATKARNHWDALVERHAPLAAHLAAILRNLPPTWLEDVFHETRLENVRGLLDGDWLPEAAKPGVYDDCEACGEVGDVCRFHTGWAEAKDDTSRLLTLATQHPEGRRIIAERAKDRGLDLDELAALGEVFDDEEVQEKLAELLDRERANRTTEETR